MVTIMINDKEGLLFRRFDDRQTPQKLGSSMFYFILGRTHNISTYLM